MSRASLVVALFLAAAPLTAQARPSLGLGVRASSVRFDEGEHADGLGVLLRLRVARVELELEGGREGHASYQRTDTRLGGALLVPLSLTRLRPHVVAAAGLNRVELPGFRTVNQAFLSAGGGLSLDVISSLSFGLDVRYTIRRASDAPMVGVIDLGSEEAIEGRLTGVVYF
jgi:hypothetical protein